ncbi:MAG: hypothetical protein KatS3mg051_0683 [Anaerolineae bacterium]|nr:MAG: hypothetical protein KatS3mg051_0683 [Anaerolineae bacterium]
MQLIGTAHGNTLENLLLNPTLSDLVGGIESVTLSDEEARRRGTQKTVLERRAPPTFNVLVEIQTRNRLVVLDDVAAAVDAKLRGRPLPVEIRQRNPDGTITIESARPELAFGERNGGRNGGRRQSRAARHGSRANVAKPDYGYCRCRTVRASAQGGARHCPRCTSSPTDLARNRLLDVARQLRVPSKSWTIWKPRRPWSR